MAVPAPHVDSPEAVAFYLMLEVASAENKAMRIESGGIAPPDREWILSTYEACLGVVRGGPAD